jgi:large subunit ribosomal protein L21
MGRYAVVKTGGKQYRVAEGDLLEVERLGGEVGGTVTLDQVLLVSGDGDEQITIGTPVVEQAQVTAEIVEQGLDKKIIVFKKKRRKGYKRKQGHRQLQTTLKITEIQA